MITHFLALPFTGLGKPNFRGNKWLANRIKMFERFVLPSLVNQTCMNFVVWCQWRKQEAVNPLVLDFVSRMERMRGLRFVHTFSGVSLWDDKYSYLDNTERLGVMLSEALPQLAAHVADSEWVYVTCQPSDDIYALDAVATIQAVEPAASKAVGFVKGYMMNYATKEVKEYDPETTPPFSTIIFDRDTFLDPQKHISYGTYESHEQVSKKYDFVPLEGRGFMVGTHGENISTTWVHPYAKRQLEGTELLATQAKFGCSMADPVVVHRRFRLWCRIAVNLLPKPLHDLVRFAYNDLRSRLLQ